jgi:hypothetical protein
MQKNIIHGMDTAPPPPPPPTQTTPAKNSRKMLIVALLLIIVIVSAVVLVVVFMGAANPNASPSGQNSNAPNTTPSSQTGANAIGNANSLKFSVAYTSASNNELSGFSYTWSSKNMGTDDMMVRIEGTIAGQQMSYIINGKLEKAWVSSGGDWMEVPDFGDEWDTWDDTWQSYEDELGDWTGGDQTYSLGGDTVRIYNIEINPNLPDSLFQR